MVNVDSLLYDITILNVFFSKTTGFFWGGGGFNYFQFAVNANVFLSCFGCVLSFQ